MSGCDGETIGFFGGSFDPPHIGHIILARDASEQLSLDRLYFVPALQSPLRAKPHAASFEDRVAMCKIVAENNPWLGVLDIEGSLPSPSYTINTARILAGMFPGADLIWLVGADQWDNLPKWKDYLELCKLLRFAVASRPGCGIAVLPPPRPEAVPLHERNIEISSTEIRERLYCKLPIDHLVPGGVGRYIASRKLYLSH